MNTTQFSEEDITQRLSLGKAIRMSEQSHARVRAELAAYADLHSSSSAVHGVATPTSSPISILSFLFSHRTLSAFMAVVLVLGVGAGTTYASERALPGEALYPIKVRVLEPAQTALIQDTKGKALRHAFLAERRLEEASTLAIAHKLDRELGAELKRAFAAHADESIADADKLAVEGDSDAAADAKSDLEAKVTAHSEILARIVASEDTKSESDAAPVSIALAELSAEVSIRKEALIADRIAFEERTDDPLVATTVSVDTSVSTSLDTSTTDTDDVPNDSTEDPTTSIATTMMLDDTGARAPTSKMSAATSVADPETTERSIARKNQIEDILSKNQAMLDSAEISSTTPTGTPVPGTSATTTASTTATTTETTKASSTGKTVPSIKIEKLSEPDIY